MFDRYALCNSVWHVRMIITFSYKLNWCPEKKTKFPLQVKQAAPVNSVFVERDWGGHVTVEQTAYHRNICTNPKEIFCRILCRNTVILYSLEMLASKPKYNREQTPQHCSICKNNLCRIIFQKSCSLCTEWLKSVQTKSDTFLQSRLHHLMQLPLLT